MWGPLFGVSGPLFSNFYIDLGQFGVKLGLIWAHNAYICQPAGLRPVFFALISPALRADISGQEARSSLLSLPDPQRFALNIRSRASFLGSLPPRSTGGLHPPDPPLLFFTSGRFAPSRIYIRIRGSCSDPLKLLCDLHSYCAPYSGGSFVTPLHIPHNIRDSSLILVQICPILARSSLICPIFALIFVSSLHILVNIRASHSFFTRICRSSPTFSVSHNIFRSQEPRSSVLGPINIVFNRKCGPDQPVGFKPQNWGPKDHFAQIYLNLQYF